MEPLTREACPREVPHRPHRWRETVGRRRSLLCPGSEAVPPAGYTVRLRPDAFDPASLERYGWRSISAAGAAMGLHPSTMRRLVAGSIAPGERVIATLLMGTGVEFNTLFQVVTEPDPAHA